LPRKTNADDAFVQIDDNLKRIFAEDAEQDLPPRLLELMNQLDQLEAPAPDPDTGGSEIASDEDTTS